MNKKKENKKYDYYSKKRKKNHEINNNFLKEVTIINNNDSIDYKIIRNIKLNKIIMLFNQKRDNDEIISKSNKI